MKLASVLVWAFLGASTPALALIGGTEITATACPAIAKVADARGHFCSAVVIGPRILVSASHCGPMTRALVGGTEFPIEWLPSESPNTPAHDFAIGVSATDFGVTPLSVAGGIVIGEERPSRTFARTSTRTRPRPGFPETTGPTPPDTFASGTHARITA